MSTASRGGQGLHVAQSKPDEEPFELFDDFCDLTGVEAQRR